MPIFKIIGSRTQIIKNFDHHPEFDVEIISGRVEPGIVFRLYETRHPCDFHILDIREGQKFLTLLVDRPIPWENAWVGAIVDTEAPEKSKKYGYRV